MAKKTKDVVYLISTAGTGYFYTKRRNKKSGKKLELNKYDPIMRKHVLFKEHSKLKTIQD